MKFKNKICPRCKKLIIGYPALSRIDNKTEICSNCGNIEALEIFYNSRKRIQKMNNIKILMVELNKEPYVKEIKNSIGEIYGIVYFPFEVFEIEKEVILISSLGAKEIKDKFFPANRIYKDKIIYSSFAILGKKNNNYISLTAEQVKKYTDMFSLDKDLKMQI